MTHEPNCPYHPDSSLIKGAISGCASPEELGYVCRCRKGLVKMLVELDVDPQGMDPKAAENMILLHLPAWVAERGRIVHITSAKIVRKT